MIFSKERKSKYHYFTYFHAHLKAALMKLICSLVLGYLFMKCYKKEDSPENRIIGICSTFT